MRNLLFVPLLIYAMDNRDVTLSLKHTSTIRRTESQQELLKERWDLEAQAWFFDWPEKERCICLHSPAVKTAIIGACASLSTATIAAIVILITQT